MAHPELVYKYTDTPLCIFKTTLNKTVLLNVGVLDMYHLY